MEILGCGMVHPSVLESAGVDSAAVLGMGVRDGPGAHGACSATAFPTFAFMYDSDMRFSNSSRLR